MNLQLSIPHRISNERQSNFKICCAQSQIGGTPDKMARSQTLDAHSADKGIYGMRYLCYDDIEKSNASSK